MPTEGDSSTLSEFDADAVLSAVRSVSGDQLRAFVEYDAETYHAMYVSGDVRAELGGSDGVTALAEKLHGDYRLDFTEKEMHEDVYSELGSVRAFGVFLDDNVIFRFVGETTGLYVSVDIDAPFNRIIDAVYDVVEEGE